MVKKFENNLNKNYKISCVAINRSLYELENRIKSIFGKNIKIVEGKQIREKEERIEEIKNKQYNFEEVLELGENLENEIREFSGLHELYRDCPVFDVKIVELAKNYKSIKDLTDKCSKLIDEIYRKESELKEIKNKIENHEIFSVKYPIEFPLSYTFSTKIRQELQTHGGDD
ncbi:MAG: hypothetical protein QXD43_01545 [Candidatus Aenigmatarchaeota archaeon]